MMKRNLLSMVYNNTTLSWRKTRRIGSSLIYSIYWSSTRLVIWGLTRLGIWSSRGGGGPTPFLPMGKLCLFPFFPMGKKYMEREGNEYFSLFFHILFFPFFPMGKNGKRHIFPMGKNGVGPPSSTRLVIWGIMGFNQVRNLAFNQVSVMGYDGV